MTFRTLGRRAFPYLVIGVGGFLLAYVLVFVFAFPAEVIPDDAKVPEVMGMDFPTAASTLEKAGFHVVQGQERFHRTIPKNTVIEQDPPGGSRQKRGTNITLAISGGQKSAQVPQVTGLPEQQAKISIANVGISLGKVRREASEYPLGTVIATNPQEGEELALPATVDLVVSDGPATVIVPDVVGRSLADARSVLEQVGLAVGGVSHDTSSIHPPNYIAGQSPAAGTSVRSRSRIRIVVARIAPPPKPDSAPPDSTPPDTSKRPPRRQ